jgi:hypothetical protein
LPIVSYNPLTPEWTTITILFEFGAMGLGSYFVFVKLIPWLVSKESIKDHRPEHPIPFFFSYLFRGVAFILLVTTLGLLISSNGWTDNLYYDVFFARTSPGNGAHINSYLLIPILGIYAAYKYADTKETNVALRIFYGGYLGLLVAALGVAIHEALWMVGYYAFYAQYLSWGVFDNVIKDVFFSAMLCMFFLTYLHYPFKKIPLRAFKGPTIIYAGFLLMWGLLGFHISTINNFSYGRGIYGETQWWGDTETNGLEILSWVLLYSCMIISVWKPTAWDWMLKRSKRHMMS